MKIVLFVVGRFAQCDRQRSLLLAAILSPVVWSALATAIPARPHEAVSGEPPASLAFDQYMVYRREFTVRPAVYGEYHFKNVGKNPLTIEGLEPSCGCLNPRLASDKKSFNPGDRGVFVVSVATANEPSGLNKHTVKVHYTDPEPREAVVHFKFNLPERKVTVDPPELAFYQYSGQPSSRTIYVTDYRGTQLEVIHVESTAEFIRADVEAPVVDERGNHRVPIALHVPGDVPPGRTRATLSIETTDPEFRRIRIPLLVDGPSRVVPVGAQRLSPETIKNP